MHEASSTAGLYTVAVVTRKEAVESLTLVRLAKSHDLDLLGSRDVIGHVTIRFPSSHFL